MDWDDLRIFLYVARAGSVLAGARAVGLDHSTVSRRIAKLENQLGVRLFERAGRRMRITDVGKSLRATAETMESVMLQRVDMLRSNEIDVSGRVRIGAPEGLGAGYLGGRIGGIANDLPRLEIELVALPQNYSLASREVDIAITLDRPQVGNVTTRKLTDYRLRLYGAPAYGQRYRWPASVADLAEHRLCGYITDLLHTKELDYLQFDNRQLSPYLKSTSIVAQMEMMAIGDVIGILPCFIASKVPSLLEILSSRVQLNRSYWLSVHDDLRQAARIKAVCDAVYDTVRKDRRLFHGEG